jgi:hypothetical protein
MTPTTSTPRAPHGPSLRGRGRAWRVVLEDRADFAAEKEKHEKCGNGHYDDDDDGEVTLRHG